MLKNDVVVIRKKMNRKKLNQRNSNTEMNRMNEILFRTSQLDI